jgi:hypothetical protein
MNTIDTICQHVVHRLWFRFNEMKRTLQLLQDQCQQSDHAHHETK